MVDTKYAASFDFSALPSAAILADVLGEHAWMIHCTKTGRPIAAVLPQERELLLQQYKVAELEEAYQAGYLTLASGVSRAWVKTDSESLDLLQYTDPHGFFCFCLGRILENHFRVTAANGGKQWAAVDCQRKFYNSLVRAFHQIAEVPGEKLEEANVVLRHFLFLGLHTSRFYKVDWASVALACQPPQGNEKTRNEPKIIQAPATSDHTIVYPHMLATAEGVSLIASHVQKIARNIASHKTMWRNWHTVGMYRPRYHRGQSLEAMFNNLLGDLQIAERIDYTSSELARMADDGDRRIKQAQASKKQANAAKKCGMFSDLDINLDEEPALPAKPALPANPQTAGLFAGLKFGRR